MVNLPTITEIRVHVLVSVDNLLNSIQVLCSKYNFYTLVAIDIYCLPTCYYFVLNLS